MSPGIKRAAALERPVMARGCRERPEVKRMQRIWLRWAAALHSRRREKRYECKEGHICKKNRSNMERKTDSYIKGKVEMEMSQDTSIMDSILNAEYDALLTAAVSAIEAYLAAEARSSEDSDAALREFNECMDAISAACQKGEEIIRSATVLLEMKKRAEQASAAVNGANPEVKREAEDA
ncbi:hypothetical protein J5N97_029031 [Dioscorea zingiberensis]|uniref:Uncharacterized protein n=1 Tax=Dioscorea zingiberensis TaxID=325984 RepID=A0A9D5C0N9_9LILI|nr:hypothetical protein J5N97_029031 [Dioscorea zingiberensis]